MDHVLESLAQLPQKRWSPAEFDALVRSGILGEDDRVELLEGAIVPMTPRGPAHVNLVGRLTRLLSLAAPEGALVSVQSPLACGRSRPQPDLAVLPASEDRGDRLPRQALLVVEVADSSRDRDRLKAALYAAAGIPELWLVLVREQLVEIHTDPVRRSRVYRASRTLAAGDVLTSAALPQVRAPVSSLFGARRG